MIYKRYRYRIYPTEVQRRTLAKHFGAVRFIYNWALETKESAWLSNGERISRYDLSSLLPIKKKELPWLKESYSQSLQVALLNLDNAYTSFYEGRTAHPKPKRKGNTQSFTFNQHLDGRECCFRAGGTIVKVPKVGKIKCAFNRQFDGKLKTVTIIKRPTGKYFVVCLVELGSDLPSKPEPVESNAIGVDLGVKTFATLSTGEVIDNPRYLSKSLKSLRRASHKHSKKKKGSKNREKSRKKLAILYERVNNQRADFLHKTSTKLIRENQTVCIEDLNVRGMLKNHKLARHIQDAGFYAFRQMLTYKAEWYGKNVLVIDRWAPSSKQCNCGYKNTELKLRHRVWTCKACGTTHDRDLLAAQNIVRFAFHPEIAKT